MKNSDEKRGELRLCSQVAVCIELESTPKLDQGAKICFTKTIDLSANGIQLISDFQLPLQSIHSLYIEIAELRFNLVGEVMWVSPMKDGYLIGFLLIESHQTDIELWKKHICQLLEQ